MKKTILLAAGIICLSNFGSAQQTAIDNAVQGTGTNQHNYVGAGWVHGSGVPGFGFNTLSYSAVADAYVTLTFVGNKVDWYTEKKNTHGIAAVSIDGGLETTVNLYSSTEQHMLAYSSPTLAHGTHTFKIRVTGTKHPASTNYYVIHDYLTVWQGAPELDNTNTFIVTPNFTTPVYDNSGFGFKALSNIVQGVANTAVGSNALTSVSKSNLNTAVGYSALGKGVGFLRTTNTAFGSYAMDVFETGSNNTAIGAYSGPVEGTFMTEATALGFGAKNTASAQVRIGNASTSSIGGQVSWSTLSDSRFKRDLKEDVSGLEFVNSLRPVSYMVDKTAIQKFLGIPEDQSSVVAKEKPIRQVGFVAQEVDALVKKSGYVFSGVEVPKNDRDPYTIRYAEFVVPLVKAVQELSARNEEQQKQIDQLLEQIGKKEASKDEMLSSEISLAQNNPNPFSRDTEIKMVLPESAVKAHIIVYNLEGKQLKDLQVNGRGNTSVSILGNELNAGMYIYALIVDGKIIDTKRMILTK